MPREGKGKWVKDKILVFPPYEDCYIYKRPNSSVYQYFLHIEGEGSERKSTKTSNLDLAKKVALDRKLEVMSRHKQGLKARRVKKLFDFIDEYLEDESKRIADYNKPGFITSETFRGKGYHLGRLKIFIGKNIRLEDLDYVKLKEYPIWRTIKSVDNPKPPKTNQSILAELTTIRAYFEYLEDKGYIHRQPTFKKLQRESLRNNRRDYLNAREYMQTINTLRAWSNKVNLTPTQSYNRQQVYNAILIMSNSLLRIGELKGLRWCDIEENTNLSVKDKKVGHLIRIRKENTKTGQSRTVQSPTVKRFNAMRELCGIPKVRGSSFPHIPPEYKNRYIFHIYNHPETKIGTNSWDRIWKEIKELCANRYWNNKNISWYSARHTGISFSVSRGVPLLFLSRNAGTGIKYITDVYYHHESESKETWETLNQNRIFYDEIKKVKDDSLIAIEDIKGIVDEDNLIIKNNHKKDMVTKSTQNKRRKSTVKKT